jgi:peroxisomal coenzyme A diphosphatase NUDT7
MRSSRLIELQEKLAKSPGILGRSEYFLSAILVPLVEVDGEEHLLFEVRADNIRQGGEVCFPGGQHDRRKEDSFLQTALRETHEELGVNSSSIYIIGQLDTLVSPRGIIVECFLGALEKSILNELHLDTTEVAEVFTVPVRWFVDNPPEVYHTRVETQSSYIDEQGKKKILLPVEDLGLPARYKKNRSEWIRRVIVYRRGSRIIWGLTASIVENIIDQLFCSDSKTGVTE